MRDHEGATLLELLIVLAIGTTVLAALLWFGQRAMDSLSLRAAAVTLVGELRAAQGRAMAERRADRRHGLEFRVGADRYAVVVQDANLLRWVREQRLPPRVRITYARFGGLPTAVVFTGMEATATYVALRYLGFHNLSLYDGSYVEWNRSEPVAVSAQLSTN